MTTSIKQLIKDAVNKLSGKPRKNTNIMFERNGNQSTQIFLHLTV